MSVHPGSKAAADASGATGSAPADAASVLRAAADMIEPEGRWTQLSGTLAHDARRADGTPCDWYDRSAVAFCALGAIHRAGAGSSYSAQTQACDLLSRSVGAVLSFRWNDAPGRTQAEVVAALRKAADLAERDREERRTDASNKPGMNP